MDHLDQGYPGTAACLSYCISFTKGLRQFKCFNAISSITDVSLCHRVESVGGGGNLSYFTECWVVSPVKVQLNKSVKAYFSKIIF